MNRNDHYPHEAPRHMNDRYLNAPYLIAVYAFKAGTSWVDRRTAADGFAEEWIVENAEVADAVAAVDRAMAERRVQR